MLRQSLAERAAVFDAYYRGEARVEDPQRGPLRDYYGVLQRLLASPELEPLERAELKARRDQTLRLLFYESRVAQRFAREHASTLARGYAALGDALDAQGLEAVNEVFPGPHGYSMADTSSYDEESAERHFESLQRLLASTLGR